MKFAGISPDMAYQPNEVEVLLCGHTSVQQQMQDLWLRATDAVKEVGHKRSKEYVVHGAARRVRLMSRCLSNVFCLFPPNPAKRPDREELDDVVISLQAFIINVYGVFDNLAWAFVFRHGLDTTLVKSPQDRKKIGLFTKETQKHLPKSLQEYLASDRVAEWHANLKDFRDALAHRIPLYIPPRSLTPEEAIRSEALFREQMECVARGDFDKSDQIEAEESALGSACDFFFHSIESDEGAKKKKLPKRVHQQTLDDANMVVEFWKLFFSHWHEKTDA